MGDVDVLGEAGPCAVRTCGDGPGEVGVWSGGEFPSSSDEEEREDGRREWVGMEMGLECFTLLSDILVEESSRGRRGMRASTYKTALEAYLQRFGSTFIGTPRL